MPRRKLNSWVFLFAKELSNDHVGVARGHHISGDPAESWGGFKTDDIIKSRWGLPTVVNDSWLVFSNSCIETDVWRCMSRYRTASEGHSRGEPRSAGDKTGPKSVTPLPHSFPFFFRFQILFTSVYFLSFIFSLFFQVT